MTGTPVGAVGGNASVAAFLALPLGTRVVVRHRVGELASDALGLLVRRSATDCDVRTGKGDVTVRFADIVAAKQVPPPPVRKTHRRPAASPDGDQPGL